MRHLSVGNNHGHKHLGDSMEFRRPTRWRCSPGQDDFSNALVPPGITTPQFTRSEGLFRKLRHQSSNHPPAWPNRSDLRSIIVVQINHDPTPNLRSSKPAFTRRYIAQHTRFQVQMNFSKGKGTEEFITRFCSSQCVLQGAQKAKGVRGDDVGGGGMQSLPIVPGRGGGRQTKLQRGQWQQWRRAGRIQSNVSKNKCFIDVDDEKWVKCWKLQVNSMGGPAHHSPDQRARNSREFQIWFQVSPYYWRGVSELFIRAQRKEVGGLGRNIRGPARRISWKKNPDKRFSYISH